MEYQNVYYLASNEMKIQLITQITAVLDECNGRRGKEITWCWVKGIGDERLFPSLLKLHICTCPQSPRTLLQNGAQVFACFVRTTEPPATQAIDL